MTERRPQLSLFHVPAIEPLGEAWHRYCQDCDADVYSINEWYMVRDEVWPLDYHGGVLCIGCLETRIGRRLNADDFISSATAACNTPRPYISRRMLDRLVAGKAETE
jgi:hypothetical protein